MKRASCDSSEFPKTIPLISYGEIKNEAYEMKLEMFEIARKFIPNMKFPAAITSVIGQYRGGKSTLLNFYTDETGNSDNFKVGTTTRSTTIGSVFRTIPKRVRNKSGEIVHMYFMDTEGLNSPSKNLQYDMINLQLSCLFSTTIVLNVDSKINESDIKILYSITETFKQVKLQATKYKDTDEEEKALSEIMPFLLIVVRNFQLQIASKRIGEDDKEILISIDEYLDETLDEFDKNIVQSSKLMLHSINNMFPKHKRRIITMPYPISDTIDQMLIPTLNLGQFKPEFVHSMQKSFQIIQENARPMTFNGKSLDSHDILQYFESCISMIGSNSVLILEDQFTMIENAKCKRVKDSLMEHWETKFGTGFVR